MRLTQDTLRQELAASGCALLLFDELIVLLPRALLQRIEVCSVLQLALTV
jgi:hypothetical protein